jgi:hypothetical protein
MSRATRRPARIRMPYVEQLAERQSPRDRMILWTLHRTRLATSTQLERLHSYELTGRSRSIKRGQVLKRLTEAGVLTTIERLIGSAEGGSEQQRYLLDTAGYQLIQLHFNRESPKTRVRRPRPPGDRFITHALAVTELYVQLVEHARLGRFVLGEFQVESDAYWPDGLGGRLKMDAFVRLHRGDTADYWWYEADMATEDLDTTIRKKLLTYLDFTQRGQLGPDGVVPQVLIGVPTAKRLEGVQGLIGELPAPADSLFRVAVLTEVARVMADEIATVARGSS